MDRFAINAALRRAGSSQSDLARKLGVSQPFVSRVISGETTSRSVADAIANTIGIPVHRLWPQKYRREPARRST